MTGFFAALAAVLGWMIALPASASADQPPSPERVADIQADVMSREGAVVDYVGGLNVSFPSSNERWEFRQHQTATNSYAQVGHLRAIETEGKWRLVATVHCDDETAVKCRRAKERATELASTRDDQLYSFLLRKGDRQTELVRPCHNPRPKSPKPWKPEWYGLVGNVIIEVVPGDRIGSVELEKSTGAPEIDAWMKAIASSLCVASAASMGEPIPTKLRVPLVAEQR